MQGRGIILLLNIIYKSENFMNQEILYFHTLKKFLFCTFHFLLIKVSEKSNELTGTEFSHIDHLYCV